MKNKMFDCIKHPDCAWHNIEREVPSDVIGFHVFGGWQQEPVDPAHILVAKSQGRPPGN